MEVSLPGSFVLRAICHSLGLIEIGIIFIKEGAPVKEIPLLSSTAKEIEAKAIEINLQNIKWLLVGIYRPPSQLEVFFLEEIRRYIEHFCTRYQNFLIIGDFNLNEANNSLQDFMHDLNLENIVKEPTCFKSDSPSCIDLILTSDSGKLSNTKTIETGLSDFHVMVATVLRGSFRKKGPRIVTYRDYSKFDNFSFREKVTKELSSNPLKKQDFSFFNSTVECILNEKAPLKKEIFFFENGRLMIERPCTSPPSSAIQLDLALFFPLAPSSARKYLLCCRSVLSSVCLFFCFL